MLEFLLLRGQDFWVSVMTMNRRILLTGSSRRNWGFGAALLVAHAANELSLCFSLF